MPETNTQTKNKALYFVSETISSEVCSVTCIFLWFPLVCVRRLTYTELGIIKAVKIIWVLHSKHIHTHLIPINLNDNSEVRPLDLSRREHCTRFVLCFIWLLPYSFQARNLLGHGDVPSRPVSSPFRASSRKPES